MNIKDFKWTEKRFGTTFANILKKLGGLSKDGTDGSIEYKDEQGNVTKLVTDSTFGSLLAKNGLIEVKWQELKDKRDNGELIPGSLYRITDYNCTTTQGNTRSADHQFDIVLLALSENKLAEEGWAIMHDNIYDVTFDDGVTKKCYLYLHELDGGLLMSVVDIETLLGFRTDPDDFTINEENKTATALVSSEDLEFENVPYNYFQNSNLSAWKVWYCLDNDTARFAWADDSLGSLAKIIDNTQSELTRLTDIDEEGYYGWENKNEGGTIFFTTSEIPNIGDDVYDENKEQWSTVEQYIPASTEPNGRGVIYRLIDEWNNDVGYDFKNIIYQMSPEFGLYTFSDFDLNEPSPSTDYSLSGNVFNVKIGNYKDSTTVDDNIVFLNVLPKNIYITNGVEGAYCRYVIFYDESYLNVLSGYISNLQINLINSTLNTVTYSSFGRNNPDLGGLDISDASYLNYGNGGVELATKDDLN